jgi:preprotein translocase subunit SecF
MDWLKNKLSSMDIDFVKPRFFFASVSTALVLASWILFFVYPGPQWGIDFQGGTEIHVKFNATMDAETQQITSDDAAPPITIEKIRASMEAMGLGDDVVQRVGAPARQEYQIRIKDTTMGSDELQGQVVRLLQDKYGADRIGEPDVDAEVGTRMDIPFNDGKVPPLSEIANALSSLEGLTVAESKEAGEVSVRLPGLAQLIRDQLSEAIDAPFVVLSTDSVGPRVGGDLRQQGFVAIAITLLLVLVYIAFRFDIGFAPGAILALLHDVSLTAGVFVLIGLEINLPIVGALLTIVGYSLNDTIVIYDRIRENTDRYSRQDLPRLINVSINETLARTLATSVTTFLAIMPFLVFGGELIPELLGMPSAGSVIWSFAFAMLLGIVFGTYSTVFVASPTILAMQDVKPWLAKLIPAFARGEDDDDVPFDGALTASERRRRERAEKTGGSER